MKRKIAVKIFVSFLVLLFLYTSISKITDYNLFREEIAQSPLLARMGETLTVMLPLSEVVAVILLLIPRYRLQGFVLALILMVLFTGYLVYIDLDPMSIPCACGGFIEFLSRKQHIALNATMIAISAIGTHLQHKTLQEKKLSST